MRESRARLGGRLVSLSVGSAPPSAAVVAWLRECFAPVSVSEGYGCTECGTVTWNNAVVQGVEALLLDRPDLQAHVPLQPAPSPGGG